MNWKFWKRKPKEPVVTVIEAGNIDSDKQADQKRIEELLQQIRDSQGPGDVFMEVTSKGVRVTKGKEE